MNKKLFFFPFVFLSVLFLTAQTCVSSYVQYDYECIDGMQSRGELGIDCGGRYCDPCVSEEEVEEEEAVDSDADSLTNAEEAEYSTEANETDSDKRLQLQIVKGTPRLIHNNKVEPFLLAQLPALAVTHEVAFAEPGVFVGNEEEVQHQWQEEADGNHRLRIDETVPCANAYWGIYIYLTPHETKQTPKLEIQTSAELTTTDGEHAGCAAGGARIYAKWFKGKTEIGDAVVSNILTVNGEGNVNGPLIASLGSRPADADGVGILLQQLQITGTSLFDDLKILDDDTNALLFETSFEESAAQYYASPFLTAGHTLLVIGVPVTQWEEGQSFISSEPLISAIQSILKMDPETDFLLSIDITPPAWWIAAHPDEAARSTKGTICTRDSRPMPSYSSDIFFSETTEKLETFVQEVRSSDVGEHVLGVTTHFAEWIVPESPDNDLDNSLCDESALAQNAFRTFLKNRYGSDEALQTAWSDTDVTLLTARIPSPSQRRSVAFVGLPQHVRDFHDFIRDQTTTRILQTGRAARAGFGEGGLFGTYGGYWLFETRVLTHTLAEGGHLAVADLLDDNTIDFFVGPVDYVKRGAGDVGGSMSLPDVFLQHGKVWVDELDLRTHLSWDRAQQATETSVESQEVILRDAARSALSGAGAWFYDIHGGAFHETELINAMAEARKFFTAVATKPLREDAAWLIIDDRALTYTSGDTTRMMLPLLFEQQRALLSSGIPLQTLLWKDAITALHSGAHPPMVVLIGPYIHDIMSEQALSALRKSTGTVVASIATIPINAQGEIVSGTSLEVGSLVSVRTPSATVTTDVLETFGIASGLHVGNDQPTAPLLNLTNITGEIFARMDDDGTPAWVWQVSPDAASVFISSVPNIPRGLFRFLWTQSGGTLEQDLGDDSLDTLQRGYGVIHCANEHVIEPRSYATIFVNGTFTQWKEPIPCAKAETILYRFRTMHK